jgi:hypothetical protein
VAGTRIPDQPVSIAPVRVPAANIPPVDAGKPGSPAVPNPQPPNPQFLDIKQIAARLGLPQDTLNLTFLIFSRFLSVSPSPSLIGTLRREILSSFKPPSGEKAAPEANARLEARALAVLSAFDKGVSLAPEALERYARLFGTATGEEAFLPFTGCNPDSGGNHRKREEYPETSTAPDAEEIKAAAEAIKDDLLDTLNSLSGKNGQYWTVFPLKINIKGIELKVYIRILNREVPLRSAHVIVDIAGPKRQWRCFLSNTRGEGKNGYRADISVYPEYPVLESLRKEAERFLGKKAGEEFCFNEIRLQNGEEFPCWADDLGSLCLPSIDEEV